MSEIGDPAPLQLPPDSDAFLDTAPPEYIRALFEGARWKFIAFVGSAICGLIGMGFMILLLLAGPMSGATYSLVPFIALAGLGFACFVVLHYVAAFRITTPDPRGIWHEPFERFRRYFRLTLWINLAFGAIAILVLAIMISQLDRRNPPSSTPVVQFGLQGIGMIWGAACVAIQMTYFRYLGERMRDLWVTNHAKLLSWLVPLLTLLFCTGLAPMAALILQVHFIYELQKRLKVRLATPSNP